MLVSECIDRAYNEWLFPAGVDRPPFDTLAAQIATTTATTFTVTGRQSYIPDDTIVEIDSELILVSDVTTTTVTAAARGYLESAAATHAAGALVYIDPEYPRVQVLNAIKSVVQSLYGRGLFVRAFDTDETFTSTTVKTLPTGGRDVLEVIASYPGYGYYPPLKKGWDYKVYKQFTPAKYHLLSGAHHGSTLQVVYKKDFTVPSAESDDLNTTCGVPTSLEPWIPMAVAGHLLRGKELPYVSTEEVRRRLTGDEIPIGSHLQLGEALIAAFENRYVQLERNRQNEADPTRIEYID